MRRFWLIFAITSLVAFVLSSAALNALAIEVSIEGPKESAPGDLVILSAKAPGAKHFSWVLANSSKSFLPVEGGTKAVFASGASGKYIFILAASDNEGLGTYKHELTIGTPEPEPPPVPPNPPTPPDPPLPPAPIPDAGFRVLIVYESGDMTKYPIETQMILAGADVRAFLKSHCVPEDGQAGFRIYDPDIDVSADLPVWKTAMSRPRKELPWLLISNGKAGFEGPLPKTPSEFLELCKKYLPTK